MGWALIVVFLVVCAGLIAQGLSSRGGIYGYPFLAGATFLGFIGPQLPALAGDAHLPAGAFTETALFTVLCAAACGLGWDAGRRGKPGVAWVLDPGATTWAAAGLTGLGAVFYYKLSGLPAEAIEPTLLSGLPVIYLFMAKLLSYGLYLAILCSFCFKSKMAVVIALAGAALLLHRVVILGRRGETAEAVLAIALAAWFVWGIAVPRTLALAGVLLAAVALNSTGDYREVTSGKSGRTWSDLSVANMGANFSDVLRNGGPEMRNAVFRVHDAGRLMAFDFGAFHWNVLVFNFVPAQIVGSAVKQSLLIPMPAQSAGDYDPPTGSTETGMADAFASFWFLGCMKFFLISYVLSRLHAGAVQGRFVSQFLYIASVVPAMLAITHHTQWFVSSWFQLLVLILPVLALARAAGSARPSPWRITAGDVQR